MSLKKTIHLSLCLFLFLVPWQTRYIYQPAFLNGNYWEYGTLSIYVTELLGWGIILLFAWQIIISNFPTANGISPWAQQFSISKNWIGNPQFKKFCVLGVFSISILIFFIAHSAHPSVSFQYIIRLMQAACLGIIILHSRIKPFSTPNYQLQTTNYSLAALWLGGVGQGLLAVGQFFTQYISPNKWLGLALHNPSDLGAFVIQFGDERWLRAYGAFGSPNSLGIYLAAILMVGLYWYLTLENKKYRLFVSLGQLIILAGLLVSFSRGAWLAAGFGLLVSLFVSATTKSPLRGGLMGGVGTMNSIAPTNGQHPPLCPPLRGDSILFHNTIRQLIFYSLLCASFLFLFYPLITARLNINNRLEYRSINERRAQWSEAIPLLKNNWLWGVGPGAYTAALARQYPDRPAWQYQPIHNIYVLVLLEWGSIGFVGILLLWIVIIKNILTKNPLAGGLVATLLVAGLFDHWLGSLYAGTLVWFLVFGVFFSSEL